MISSDRIKRIGGTITGDENVVAGTCQRKNGGTRATQISRRRSSVGDVVRTINKDH